jgi:hypothetical protein
VRYLLRALESLVLFVLTRCWWAAFTRYTESRK